MSREKFISVYSGCAFTCPDFHFSRKALMASTSRKPGLPQLVVPERFPARTPCKAANDPTGCSVGLSINERCRGYAADQEAWRPLPAAREVHKAP